MSLLESIVNLLESIIDLTLQSEDVKHKKKVAEEENRDKKKRPFKKYLLQPSNMILLCLVSLTIIGSYLFSEYLDRIIKPKNTTKELLEMRRNMLEWYDELGYYPNDLTQLIGNNPTRKSWRTDAWGNEYHFYLHSDKSRFTIRSAGSDELFDTKDDIETTN